MLSNRSTSFDRYVAKCSVTTGRIRCDRNLARHAMSDRVFPAVTSGGAKFSDRQPRQSDLSSGFRREMRVASLAVRTRNDHFLRLQESSVPYVRTTRYPWTRKVARGIVPIPNPSISCYLFRSSG